MESIKKNLKKIFKITNYKQAEKELQSLIYRKKRIHTTHLQNNN